MGDEAHELLPRNHQNAHRPPPLNPDLLSTPDGPSSAARRRRSSDRPSSSALPQSAIPNSALRSGVPHHFTEEVRSSPQRRDLYEIFPNSTSQQDEEAILNMKPIWKRKLHFLLERPTTSQAAFVVHVLSTFLIVLSALITILETVPTFHSIPTAIWFGMETTLVALFTVEYICRCIAWSYTWSALLHWVICASFYLFFMLCLPVLT